MSNMPHPRPKRGQAHNSPSDLALVAAREACVSVRPKGSIKFNIFLRTLVLLTDTVLKFSNGSQNGSGPSYK